MKTLYIECNMGAAGDMLMGALLELAPDGFGEKLSSLGLTGVDVHAEKREKCGITGTHVHVIVNGVEEGHEHEHKHDHEDSHTHDHEHSHTHEHIHDESHGGHCHSMADIEHMILILNVSDKVKSDAINIYKKIAAAESTVHGHPVSEIHFHEVGAKDAVADVVGNCMLMEAIGADRVVVSPVNVGNGTVKCSHGILPVPAPATSEILKGAVYYSDDTIGELCTPTGAAILQYFATEYGNRPVMQVSGVGIGVGNKDFAPKANIVRAFLGEEKGTDKICELAANIDDMTGEELGFAMESLLDAGAVDVYFVPIVMKKSRPAVKLSCLCRIEDAETMAEVFFKHTKTVGIRRQDMDRYILDRKITQTNGLRVKTCSGYGVTRSKVEYDDLAEIAKNENKSLDEVKGEKL